MGSLVPVHSDDFGKLILRFSVGGMLLFHGLSKLMHGIGWLPPLLQMHGLPGFLAYGVFIAEIVAPLLLFAGLWTRLASAAIVVDMIMAVALVLRSEIFAVKQGGGGWGIELEAFFLLGSLAIFFLGAGKYSFSKGSGKWD
ncbi:MAG TPA: DoxX family protein [Bacteroidota bacterium]